MVFNGKKAALSTGMIIFLVAAALVVLNVGGLQDTLKGFLPSGTSGGTGGAVTCPAGQVANAQGVCQTRCYVEDTTLTLGPAQEMYNPSTKLTTEYHRVFVNSVDQGLKADSTDMTVNPGDKIQIIYAENATGYAAASQSFTVSCEGKIVSAASPDSNAYKAYANDANNMTRRLFNEDNGNLNSVTDNETLNAGDKPSLKMQLLGTFEDAYSPYGPIVVVVEANQTTYKDFAIGSFPTVSCPGQYAVSYTGAKGWCFAVTGPDGKTGLHTNEQIDTNLAVEVQTSVNPMATGGDALNISFYDSDYFLNTDTGVEELGVETNDDTDVGIGQSASAQILHVYVK